MGQKDRNYKILAACFSDMRRVCENLVQAVREKLSLFPWLMTHILFTRRMQQWLVSLATAIVSPSMGLLGANKLAKSISTARVRQPVLPIYRTDWRYSPSSLIEPINWTDFPIWIQSQYSKEFGAQKVEVLSNATVDMGTLKKDVYYFQVDNIIP